METDPADALGDAELREVRSDRVAHPCAMLDQHRSGSMQYQHALLLDGLRLRKSHVWAGDRFADCFGICFIVLLGLAGMTDAEFKASSSTPARNFFKHADRDPDAIWPNLLLIPRAEQKLRAQEMLEKALRHRALMNHPETDRHRHHFPYLHDGIIEQ
jgi:hypothetical protein